MKLNKRLSGYPQAALCLLLLFMSLTTDHAFSDEVTLKGGDVIHGDVIKQDDSGILLKHEDLGKIKIDASRIASVLVLPDEAAPAEQAEPEEGPPPPKHLIEEPEFEKLEAFAARAKEYGWSASLDLSLISESGNTDEQSFRVGGKLGRKFENIKYSSDLSYYNKESDKERTDDKLTVGFTRDESFADSDWFWFMMGRYDYDLFESWRHRASFHVGPGYKLIQKPDFWLNLRSGPGVRKEWGSDTTDPEFEGNIGGEFEWKPTAKQTFSFSTLYYTVLNDFDDYRTRTVFEWDYLLNNEMNLSFVMGILHEYQAIVDPDKDRNDTRIHSGFRFRF